MLALGLGTGLSPRAPGTVGTLLGFPLYAGLHAVLTPTLVLLSLAALFILGIPVCAQTARDLGVADPGAIVWDEIVAFALVLAFAPSGWAGWTGAFLLFRLFDILKPFPVNIADRKIKGGLGVMLDDLLAAGYAIASLLLVTRLVHA